MQLRVTITGNDFVLPMANQHYIQSAIYAMIAQGDKQLATKLHNGDVYGRNYKGFTFSPLSGAYKLEGKSIHYLNSVQLTIRCLNKNVMDALLTGIVRSGTVRLGSANLTVVDLKLDDSHIT